MKRLMLVPAIVGLAGCAGTNTIQTSADTAIVSARAAPVCGSVGAARVAQRQAAIETLRAGYDRYIIFDAASASNVQVTQMPGSYQTSGTIWRGNINATTTYQPGPTIVSGGHSQDFAIKMFKDGQAGASQAISAKATLGPKWQEKLKSSSLTTCT